MASGLAGIPAPVVITPQERKLFTQTYGGVAQTQRTYSPDFTKSLYPKLILRLNGSLNKTESAPGTLGIESPFSLIKGIRILGDGDLIKEIDGPHLRVLSHFIMRGQDTNSTNVTLGTDAAEVFSARLELDFQSLRSDHPEASWWDASRYNQISFEVDWGTIADLVAGGTYTGVTFGVTTLDVYGQEILNPTARNQNYLTLKYQQKVFSVSSVLQSGMVFQLPVGEVIRGLLLSQYTLAPKTPITTLILPNAALSIRITGPAGSYTKLESVWSELTQRNQSRYGIAPPAGYAFIDFCEDGDIQKSLRADGGGVTAVELRADVASVAGAFLQVTMVTYKPGLAAPRAGR